MDDVAQYNIERWAALANANAVFTRPHLDLTPAAARTLLDPDGRLGSVAAKQVLCLASGGGQQSVAFALLGAVVTVVDLSAEQLQRDAEAAAHYKLHITTVHSDMRDLSFPDAASFDIVYQPYSINFVPDARVVFAQVARVLRHGGVYYFNCANPFASGVVASDWNGAGYLLRQPYVEGAELTYADEPWVFRDASPHQRIKPPKEYRHTLSTLINGLIAHDFVIDHVMEEYFGTPDINAAPGTMEHLSAIAPPWIKVWAKYRPKAVE